MVEAVSGFGGGKRTHRGTLRSAAHDRGLGYGPVEGQRYLVERDGLIGNPVRCADGPCVFQSRHPIVGTERFREHGEAVAVPSECRADLPPRVLVALNVRLDGRGRRRKRELWKAGRFLFAAAGTWSAQSEFVARAVEEFGE